MSIAEFLKDPKAESVGKVSAAGVDSAAKLRKQVFGIFGSVVVLGLALAGWYVAYRIIAERGTRVASTAVVTIPVASPAPAAVQPAPAPPSTVAVPPVSAPVAKVAEAKPAPVPEAKPVASVVVPAKPPAEATRAKVADVTPPPVVAPRRGPFERHDLNPQHGEKYWQIAAYGPKSLDAYLKILEGQGRSPLVAPGPAENIYRILVGPFKDADALEQARRSIEAMGIEPILRSY